MNQLQDFENDCGNWLDNLLSSEMQKAEAAKEIKVHIDQISRLCNEIRTSLTIMRLWLTEQ